MNCNYISIFQRNWAFTASDAPQTQIITGSFGPCYVVSFISDRFAALAHIDDVTEVDSISAIFKKFIDHSVELKTINVAILGGWIDHPESFKWGTKIVKNIAEAGFIHINIQHMFEKKALTASQLEVGMKAVDTHHHYQLGAMVDAKKGQTFFLGEVQFHLELEQKRQNKEYVSKYGIHSTVELPLSQVLS